MVLVKKWPFFQLFFLGSKGKENVLYDFLERKKPFLGYKNKKFKNLKNSHFFKGVNPWFWSQKMAMFPTFFFFRELRQGKCLLQYSRTENRLSRL